MVVQSNCTFVENANTPIVSKTFINSQGDVLSIQICGATGVFHLEGRTNKDAEWVSLAGIDLSDFSAHKGGFTKPGMYELGIIGVRQLRARVESTTGDVSIFGQIISSGEV